MADAADLLARLHPVRLPAASAEGMAAEALAAFALGLALAALAMLALGLAARRRPSRRSAALRALAATRALPPPERLARQIALLRDAAQGDDWARLIGTSLGPAARAALYGAGPQPDPDLIERTVRRALARLAD